MSESDPLLTAIAALNSQMSALQAEIRFLSDQVKELKSANEDRRTSIDAVAGSLRFECANKNESVRSAIANHTERLASIDQKIQVGQWLILTMGGALATLLASKIATLTLTPEHSPKSQEQAHAIIREFPTIRASCLPNCEQAENLRTV